MGSFHSNLQKEQNVHPHDETKRKVGDGEACIEGKTHISCIKTGLMALIKHNIRQVSIKLSRCAKANWNEFNVLNEFLQKQIGMLTAKICQTSNVRHYPWALGSFPFSENLPQKNLHAEFPHAIFSYQPLASD